MSAKPKTRTAGVQAPDGWEVVSFGEIARCIGDRVDDPSKAGVERYVGLEHLDPESLKIRRWGKPTDVEAQKLRFQPGDIIFGKRRAYQRKLAVADFEGICSAHAMVLRANTERIEKDFLPFFMQSDVFFDRALSISVGSLSPTINWRTLAEQEFVVPPRKKQIEMAEVLWAVEDDISATIALGLASRSLASALQADCFGRVLSRTCPTGWSRTTLGKLFAHRKETGHDALPILSVTIDGRMVPRASLERNVIDNTGTDKYFRVQPGDIAYNTMRLWQGSCALAPAEGIVSPAYTVLTPRSKSTNSTYFGRLFRYPPMMDIFRRLSIGVAADRWRLYYKDLAKVTVNLPPPEAQREAVCSLMEADQIDERGVAKLLHLKQLRTELTSQFLHRQA